MLRQSIYYVTVNVDEKYTYNVLHFNYVTSNAIIYTIFLFKSHFLDICKKSAW